MAMSTMVVSKPLIIGNWQRGLLQTAWGIDKGIVPSDWETLELGKATGEAWLRGELECKLMYGLL